MLRKSAETAGIHPVYLDIISSNFAMLIENANTMREAQECKSQMISAYCRFVRKNRLDQYSPLVRIAKGIRVSPSYLSRLFNRETGDSISNYITKARVEKAAGLLSFSGMSIQNIAFYVGFGDLNYFSRCFKKYKRMTPTEYRASSSIGV
nr:AraC family transcriptional regulator [Enterocloster clostridioformis]